MAPFCFSAPFAAVWCLERSLPQSSSDHQFDILIQGMNSVLESHDEDQEADADAIRFVCLLQRCVLCPIQHQFHPSPPDFSIDRGLADAFPRILSQKAPDNSHIIYAYMRIHMEVTWIWIFTNQNMDWGSVLLCGPSIRIRAIRVNDVTPKESDPGFWEPPEGFTFCGFVVFLIF